MANKLSVAQVDFDSIKNNLKNYLKSQSEFDSYDFEGSGLNILLDVLAYNTHYNAFYLNMVANEMFMDSAALRKSIVSHAKLLGYTPRSTTAAVATVNVAITKSSSDSTNILTLPRFTTFTSQSTDGKSYQFVSLEQKTVTSIGNVFNFTNVQIKEGIPVSYVYQVDTAVNPKQIFDLPDVDIDTSTLQIIVQGSETETRQEVYTLATDSTEITGDSKVYYLEEGENGKYRIYFGDGVFGNQLKNGNLVAVSYINTKGNAANDLTKFSLAASPLSGSTSSVTTVAKSSAGSIRELAEDIRFAAPKTYIANNRAVTKNDYIALINKKFPFYDSVNVWGGEELNPPIYGKVFVSAKPKEGFVITEAQKNNLINDVIRPINMLTIIPEFVDPDYNYLNLLVTVNYDPKLTVLQSGELISAVRTRIATYIAENLNTFYSSFELSKLLADIDTVDDSIQSSSVSVTMEKRFDPVFNISRSYTFNCNTPIARGAFGSDKLTISPAFKAIDSEGFTRDVFIEEIPNSFTGIESAQIINAGSNYTALPRIAILGDGIGAELQPVVVNGRIQSVKVISQGSNYTYADLIVIPAENDSGSGAQLSASIRGTVGKIRSYFFDQSGEKRVLNNDAGNIFYNDGRIVLNNLKPTDVNSNNKTLKLYFKPSLTNFSSGRSSILTVDLRDSNSLIINLNPVSKR